ncbi:thioredoxin fold domain-containing protein [Acidithiobacillus sp. IBUN Pt1247-S3]|uniref:thioredoxin fold domain-containing protein n=1 Tax=Acidithiobacillus sp. IBUN Pt1247-S3 TaxID=3166642 RepID=UPI0034E38372
MNAIEGSHLKQWIVTAGFLTAVTVAGSALATTSPLPKMSQPSYWSAIGHKLTYIQEGHKGPIIYDFFDPNCPYCHSMYEEEQSLVQTGKVTIRYVPVAYLLPSSQPEAAAILQTSHPLAALGHFEVLAGKSFAAPIGPNGPVGLPRVKASAHTIQALSMNMAVLQSTHSMGVPAILYLRKDGQTALLPGMVSRGELLTLLPNLARS